jgi:deoxyribonuclease-4
MERFVGLDNVGAFHLNDSKKPLGSRVDRHQHIGEGELGLEPFRLLLNDARFARIPKVIETPKTVETESDVKNLRTLRSLIGVPDRVSARHARRRATRRVEIAL